MPIFESQSIKSVAIHSVGCKATDEGYTLSRRLLPVTEQLQDLLVQYFVSPFKAEEYYHLSSDEGPEGNPLYGQVRQIFHNPDQLLEVSKRLAAMLYNQSEHPNIKPGEFYTAYFDSCIINGETTQAVGLFKSETKERFFKVSKSDEQWSRQQDDPSAEALFDLEVHQGTSLRKLDKGALIFNLEEAEGYVVSIVDATNRGADAAYWADGFIGIAQRHDEFYHTHEVMTAYKQFVTTEVPEKFEEVSKADQADLLNRSVSFFKANDQFDMADFERDVLVQPEIIDSFLEFRQGYEQRNEVEIPEQFPISEAAVKKQSRAYKSVIKLDKNFHIYVHGNRQLIEQGEDERGKFYKVYYNEES